MSQLQRTQPTKTDELLSTKLAPPRLRSPLVSREPLLARLDEGLEHKLTLVSAPAGFGKTTLVSEWLAAHSARQGAPVVAWVSLDAGDNDPVRFWRYVLTACQTFQPDIGASALALLRLPQQPPFEAMLTTFINELAQLSGQHVLVLEDYHIITSSRMHETMTFLLDHLPPMLHLILLTRSDPPLPLARLRARNDIVEVRAGDLRFSLAEMQVFFQQTLKLPLSGEVIERLEARTEGWVAGLQLVALALQRRQEAQEVERFLVTFAGSHGRILEYLVEEVLHVQPASLQEFLLQTTFLNRLTGSLCDAVTGRNDSAGLLEQLERANLFLLPLDAAQQWYRYHALFAEAMQHYARRQLGEASLRALYDKASLWYEQHGLPAEAIEAALLAQKFDHAAALIEHSVESHRFSNSEAHTMRRWIEYLPEEVLRPRPALSFTYAMMLLFTKDRQAPATRTLLQAPLKMAEQCWQAEDNQAKLGEALAFRSMVAWWQGDFSQTFAAARQALELLPEGETFWRGVSLLHLSLEELLAGRINAAKRTLTEARTLSERAGNLYAVRAATFLLGDICVRQGELHQAAQIYRQVLTEAGEDLSDRSYALFGLGALAYEWNDLERAEQDAAQALELGQRLVENDRVVHASLVLARVQHALGNTRQAQQLLHSLVAWTQRSPLLLREVRADQAWLALMVGDMAAVQRWATSSTQPGDDVPFIQQEREALIMARLLIAQDEADAALLLLEPWQAEAQGQERTRSDLEIKVLTALAHFSQQNLAQAKQTLIEALTLAQAEGYQRLFLDEGARMAALLQVVLPEVKETPLGAYIRTLLLAFAQGQTGQTSAPSVPSPLLEPLSPQEQRVLRLLAAGLSNPEIAEELIVSLNTIKTQVQSIYRKLDVHSREEASDVARQLNLL